jgi:hypothetical protein
VGSDFNWHSVFRVSPSNLELGPPTSRHSQSSGAPFFLTVLFDAVVFNRSLVCSTVPLLLSICLMLRTSLQELISQFIIRGMISEFIYQ